MASEMRPTVRPIVVRRVFIDHAEKAPELEKLRNEKPFQELLRKVKEFKDPDRMPYPIWKEFYEAVFVGTIRE